MSPIILLKALQFTVPVLDLYNAAPYKMQSLPQRAGNLVYNILSGHKNNERGKEMNKSIYFNTLVQEEIPMYTHIPNLNCKLKIQILIKR